MWQCEKHVQCSVVTCRSTTINYSLTPSTIPVLTDSIFDEALRAPTRNGLIDILPPNLLLLTLLKEDLVLRI